MEAVKVGPWGGSQGTPRDINDSSKPRRLETITIFSTEAKGGRVYGLSFEYKDQRKQIIPVSTFGSKSKGNGETISLGDTEYVYQVSGTIDAVGVSSLKFVTSTGIVYGPYGCQSGNQFWLPLEQDQGKVVAFFGRSTDSLVALGVYVLPGTTGIVRVGGWGGVGIRRYPESNVPCRLTSFTFNHSEGNGARIYGLSFKYLDQNGRANTVGPWGSTKGIAKTFTLDNMEYVTYIGGTTDEKGVTSLDIHTTKSYYVTMGSPSGATFSLPMNHGNGTVLSFFARQNDDYLAGLGVYLGPRT